MNDDTNQSGAPDPSAANAQLIATKWQVCDLYRELMLREMARTGHLDHAAIERRTLDRQMNLGLLVADDMSLLPLDRQPVAEAILAELTMHGVLFEDAGRDDLRFRTCFDIAARCRGITIVARGQHVALSIKQAARFPEVE